MHLVNCEHPKMIFNKYTKEFVRVRCGTCSTCQVSRAADWVLRVDLENAVHKYCFMVTLTYDDDHLPAFFFNDKMDSMVLNRDESICIPLNHLYDYIYQNDEDTITKELDYLRSRLIHPLGLPACYPKDISDFFKRLNINTKNYVTGTFENYRYFCCHEYGPSTYRPHCHMLVWFEDDSIARLFPDLLLKSWSFGRSDASAVYSNGGRSYVSQYVNMSCHLPSFYKIRGLRPSHQESKFPSIGSDVVLDSQVRKLYDSIPVKRDIYKSSSQRYVCLPVSNAVKSRFFPKLQGYYRMSDSVGVKLYGAYALCPHKQSSFEDFYGYVRGLHRNFEMSDYVRSYFALEKGFPFGSDERLLIDYFSFLSSLSADEDSLRNSVRRWYFISKRICYYASLLNCRLDYLVSRIFEFWKKFDYECLKSMYELQQSYVQSHSFSHLVVMYPDFYRNLCFYVENPSERPFYIDAAMNSFDIFDLEDIPDFKKLPDYLSMKENNQSIYKDTHKRMAINSYLEKRLIDADPELYSIVKTYQS